MLSVYVHQFNIPQPFPARVFFPLRRNILRIRNYVSTFFRLTDWGGGNIIALPSLIQGVGKCLKQRRDVSLVLAWLSLAKLSRP